jgi:hypothetical protein
MGFIFQSVAIDSGRRPLYFYGTNGLGIELSRPIAAADDGIRVAHGSHGVKARKQEGFANTASPGVFGNAYGAEKILTSAFVAGKPHNRPLFRGNET